MVTIWNRNLKKCFIPKGHAHTCQSLLFFLGAWHNIVSLPSKSRYRGRKENVKASDWLVGQAREQIMMSSALGQSDHTVRL